MMNLRDPICALITPPGTAAISVIRISGNGAVGIVASFFRPRAKLLKSPSHRVIHGLFHDRDGRPLDEVLCTVFRAPHSYSGEDTIEISCHGNPQIATAVLETLLSEARHAEPGEFTLRAVMNHKLDLTQAEAVNDLIHAVTPKASAAALMQVRGVLRENLQDILDRITDARLRCELSIDFADQDLPPLDFEALRQSISALRRDAEELWAAGQQGRYIRDGIRVCLAGAPNAGKSSLFNAMLKQNRAIVTPHPGTTRDYLEESISMRGYSLVIYDTAGLRDTGDEIERQGIDRSRELMLSADLVLYLIDARDVLDGTAQLPELDAELAAKCVFVLSKADLTGQGVSVEVLPTIPGVTSEELIPASVMDAGGLQALSDAIMRRFQLPEVLPDRPLVTNTRHLAALSRCINALKQAEESLAQGSGFEFTAFDLIAASSALEEILGVIPTDTLLGEIFANFCIGK